MNIRRVFIWAFVSAVTFTAVSCGSNEDFGDYDYDQIEQQALDNYMKNIDGAYRQKEGYWIEPIDLSSRTGIASNNGTCWVRYNFTSRSLVGDVCNTRNEAVAKQQGTFNYYTCYMPYMVYLTNEAITDKDAKYGYNYYYEDQDSYVYNENSGTPKVENRPAINTALKSNSLIIDGEMVSIYEGNKFKIYTPSAGKGSYYNGSGGYAGASYLDAYRPMVSEVEVVEVISNAATREENMVDNFITLNDIDGSDWVKVEDVETYEEKDIFINYTYNPSISYTYVNPYKYGELPYYDITGFDALESAMNEQLLEEYGEGVTTGKSVGLENEAKIWYVVRTLDGFVVDTNITEIGVRAFGSSAGCGTRLIYNASEDYNEFVSAFYFAVPMLKYGAWATIVTKSDYAYGSMGQNGESNKCEIAPFTPLIFNVYVEPNDDLFN